MNVLVINSGSSSIKFQLLDMPEGIVMANGLCERIGIDGHMKYQPLIEDKPTYDESVGFPTHAEALTAMLDVLISQTYGVIDSVKEIDAIGLRSGHPGEKIVAPTLITDEVIKIFEECIPLAPLHNPAGIIVAKACAKIFNGIPQVTVFDTSFHQTMPEKSYILPIPYKYYEEDKVRRYGFHGTSQSYVVPRAAEVMGKPVEGLKIVSCHLGNGSSITAIDGGKSVDTSMGFTPLGGIPMGTRSGDMDPSVLQFIMEQHDMDISEMLEVLNKESGVLGISGLSSDFRDLIDAAAKGHKRAALALACYEHSIVKHIGAYAAVMGGVDALVFTGGVGENAPSIRVAICETLGFLGLVLDPMKNNLRGQETIISSEDSAKKILLIPTNEELVIARETVEVVSKLESPMQHTFSMSST